MSTKRRLNRQRFAVVGGTPTHYVRLHRLRIPYDEGRVWFAVEIDVRRERKVVDGFERAGFLTCSPANVEIVPRRHQPHEVREHYVAGLLFVGVPVEGWDGDKLSPIAARAREALWMHHSNVVTSAPTPFEYVDQDGHRVRHREGEPPERPFYRVIGPFRVAELQRFNKEIRPELRGVLYAGDAPIAVFPAREARLFEGQSWDLYSVGNPALAKHEGD